jgi:hypothetical protein
MKDETKKELKELLCVLRTGLFMSIVFVVTAYIINIPIELQRRDAIEDYEAEYVAEQQQAETIESQSTTESDFSELPETARSSDGYQFTDWTYVTPVSYTINERILDVAENIRDTLRETLNSNN